MNGPLKFVCACYSIIAGGILTTASHGAVPLYSGCDENGEQVIDSTSLTTNVIKDLTDHTYNKPVSVGQFSDCVVRRVFSCPIESIKVTLVHLTTNAAVDSADDIGYVGNILVTPDSTNTPCFNEGSVLRNYNVTSQVTVNGNEATLLLRAKENCCCDTGWGQDTRSDRVPARFRWEVVLATNGCAGSVPLYSGCDKNGEQVIDSTALTTDIIDDLTDHTYNKPVPVGAFSDCLIRRVFPCNIEQIEVTLVALTTNGAVDSADDIGFVGNLLVTPDSTNTPCFNEGSVLANYDVTSQVVINGNEAGLLLRAKENCCCDTGWGQDTRSDRVPARFRWRVKLSNSPLAILCPGDIKRRADPGQCSAIIHYREPIVRGGCSVTNVVCSPPSGSAFPVGVTVVTCTATDASGEAAKCSFKAAVRQALPTVTIDAADPIASEPGTDPGKFVVTRTGCTNLSLTVFYTIGGTASSGVDYKALTGKVTIPAGKSAAAIGIKPLDDALVEPVETVIVTLSSRPPYIVGSPSSATVDIRSND